MVRLVRQSPRRHPRLAAHPPRPPLLALPFASANRRARDQRREERIRRRRDLLDGALERGAVGLGGLLQAAHLANELKRRGLDLLWRRRRIEVVEHTYVAAHARKASTRAGARAGRVSAK